MREPWAWTEEDIQSLITEQRPEDLQLEYKKSDSLAKAKEQKTEIAKDVSAMANSAGGVLVYGVDEQKKSGGPIILDAGVDSAEISTEWLEQVIDSNIQRRIDDVRVNPVRMSATGNLVYVVYIPQSSRAPHMASDRRYHKRLGTTTARMEEYEVRDVGRRLESPRLYLKIGVARNGTGGRILLLPSIGNTSTEPALYATCRIYVQDGLDLALEGSHPWTRLADTEMLWRGERSKFRAVRLSWSVPGQHPILEGEEYKVAGLPLSIAGHQLGDTRRFKIGWELRAPKTFPELRGLELTDDAGMICLVSADSVAFAPL